MFIGIAPKICTCESQWFRFGRNQEGKGVAGVESKRLHS